MKRITGWTLLLGPPIAALAFGAYHLEWRYWEAIFAAVFVLSATTFWVWVSVSLIMSEDK